jgi:hypothetical protein
MKSKLKFSLAVPIVALGLSPQATHARWYRTAVTPDLISDTQGCRTIQPYSPYIYPAPNWQPFFSRHYYRYGPLLTCALPLAPAALVPQPVVTAKF